jgi:TetR/AcrR family transcriptional regulator, cholesterol catabolism regulator
MAHARTCAQWFHKNTILIFVRINRCVVHAPTPGATLMAARGEPRARGTARRATTKARLTRERILEAAAAVLRERGVVDLRLPDVAERAGLQTPSIYYHFRSREELIEEVVVSGVNRTFARVQERVDAVDPGDPAGRLQAAVIGHLEMVVETGSYNTVNLRMFGQMPGEIRVRVQRRQRVVRAYWDDLLIAARDAGVIRDDLDLHAVRMLILGALNWTAEWYRPGRLPLEAIATQASSLVLDGLLVR